MKPQDLLSMLGQGIQSGVQGAEDFVRNHIPSETHYYGWTPQTPNAAPLNPFQTPAPAQAAIPPQNANVTPQATTTPQATPPGGFRYQMGLSDYSAMAPQVQAALKGTPLEGQADQFIQAGNKHKVDPRVLVSIAGNESSFGKTYPVDSYNPFGYNARNGGMITGPDGKQYVNVDQGLKNAGFTSLPMAIDRMTQRFSDHPYNPTPSSYAKFRQDPTIENLQAAYNASEDEKQNYIKNLNATAGKYFK